MIPAEPAASPPYRRLTLLDLAGVIAACGVGVGCWTVYARELAKRMEKPYLAPESFREWLDFGSTVALTLALMVVLRESTSRLRPRPITLGGSACLAIVVATTFLTLDEFVADHNRFRFGEIASLSRYAFMSFVIATWQIAGMAGAVLATAIVWLRLVGSRRATGGIDRLGRGVGCWFLLAFVADAIAEATDMMGWP